MSDGKHALPLPPGLMQILTLATAHHGAWQSALAGRPGGRGLGWTHLDQPEKDIGSFVRKAAQTQVVILSYAAGSSNLTRLQQLAWQAWVFGAPHLIVTVEREVLPPEGRKGFDRMIAPLANFIKQRCEFKTVSFIPVSSEGGGNIDTRDRQLGWYMGPTLEDELNTFAKTYGSIEGQEKTAIAAFESDHVQARVIWLSEAPLIPWRPLQAKLLTRTIDAKVTSIKYELDAHSTERIARNRLRNGDIAVCNIAFDDPAPMVAFDDDHSGGMFDLTDPDSGETVAIALVDYALRRASNIKWQETTITPDERAGQKSQKAAVLWFTGLSGAGKSTIADMVEKRLAAAGKHTMLLDGDNVRHGLNKDLGFTDFDRVENIRRISEVSKLMCDAGLIVLVSFISPFATDRELARETVGGHGFYEIFIATPLNVAEQRDVKGLYAKARRGEIKNFTGIDSPYEEPDNPDIRIDTTAMSAEDAAEHVVSIVLKGGGAQI